MKSTILLLTLLLFSCKDAQTPNLPDPYEAGWEGEKVCEILEENDEMRVLRCTFPPQIGHEKHYHPPHFGYTLIGSKFRITDSSGVREVDVPTGYSFAKDYVSVHEAVNIGDTTAVFLIVEYK